MIPEYDFYQIVTIRAPICVTPVVPILFFDLDEYLRRGNQEPSAPFTGSGRAGLPEYREAKNIQKIPGTWKEASCGKAHKSERHDSAMAATGKPMGQTGYLREGESRRAFVPPGEKTPFSFLLVLLRTLVASWVYFANVVELSCCESDFLLGVTSIGATVAFMKGAARKTRCALEMMSAGPVAASIFKFKVYTHVVSV